MNPKFEANNPRLAKEQDRAIDLNATPAKETGQRAAGVGRDSHPIKPEDVVAYLAEQEKAQALAKVEAAKEAKRQAYFAGQEAKLAAFKKEQLEHKKAQDAARLEVVKEGLDISSFEDFNNRKKSDRPPSPAA